VAGSLLTPRALTHGLKILKGAYLNHQFERKSPLMALPPELLNAAYTPEIVLPPRRHVEKPGGQTLEGLVFLAGLVRALDVKTAFEIGTFDGVTTWTLARNMRTGVVDTLDLPSSEPAELAVEDTDEEVRSLLSGQVYDELPHPATIEQHWGDSASFDFSTWNGKCDLVYIDGAHSEPYVESDTRNAFAMLSERGAIVWDDYWRQVNGVPKVLHGLAAPKPRRVPGTRLAIHLTSQAEEHMGTLPGSARSRGD
jgi:predicted O-methyltransferase YrrM